MPLLTKQEILPRFSHGADYGADAKVIVRQEEKLLAWRPAFSRWNTDNLGQRYTQPQLILYEGFDLQRGRGRILHEGGRLSRRHLRRLSDSIDAIFGNGTTEQIDPKRTLVLAT